MWEASQALGARSASIHDLYMARGRGEVSGFTVPAINIRAQTFDMARTFFETAARADVGAVIFELARSEQTYTFQRPMDYATFVLAGAIAAGWRHPVFIQGDHYQFNAKKYAADPEAMTEEIRRACRLAIDAGYRNIDIDSSTLVDLSKPDRDEEQRENYVRAAELTALIRGLETDGVTVSVGGEIGEVGKQNSTADELERVPRRLRPRAGHAGARRVGPVEGQRPDRDVATAACRCPAAASRRSSSTSRSCATLGEIARARRAGRRGPARRVDAARRAVPPLPGGRDGRDPPRDGLPERALRAPGVPGLADGRDLRLVRGQRRRRAQGRPDRRAVPVHDAQEGDRPVQAPAVGPGRPEDEILAAQGTKLGFLFTELRVNGSMELVERYVQPVPRSRGRSPSRSPSRSRAEPAAMTAGVDGPSASDGDARPLAVSIRFETPGDEPGIRAVELAAFSGPEEAEIVDRDPRRCAGRLAVAGRRRTPTAGSSATS